MCGREEDDPSMIDAYWDLALGSRSEQETPVENYCKYGHYEEGNPRLPECINENYLERICPECGRIFNIRNENDANEFFYGHDCEVK